MQPLQECKSGGDGGAAPEEPSSNLLQERKTCESRGVALEKSSSNPL